MPINQPIFVVGTKILPVLSLCITYLNQTINATSDNARDIIAINEKVVKDNNFDLLYTI